MLPDSQNISYLEARSLLAKPTTRHKYNAQKVVVEDKTFDSKKEADYYLYLRSLLAQGRIKSIELQPKFILQPSFTHQDKKHRAITYKADFKVVHTDGTVEVIDVKGVRTQAYQIKKKLFLFKYPDIIFTEA